MMLRTNSALGGMVISSASSTERTDASECTVVQTPQTRPTNAQASRGSRPRNIFSMPRTMVPEEKASVIFPF
jgi:hypothetical protein